MTSQTINFLLGLSLVLASVTDADDKISFNRDIRPILSDNCFRCHGQDGEKRAADIRLDTLEGQRAANVVVPGSPSASLLVERILSSDLDVVMPPPDSNKTLTDAQRSYSNAGSQKEQVSKSTGR